MDDETLAVWRYCFQRILVPCVVIIGVLGNAVSVVVLTRRRMRCTTNIYLTALAVADIVFLCFIFILSLQHYPNMHSAKYVLYWRTLGISHWFCDASSYTSIYLTVSFTIERYIAVCHPIKGQILCTESRARRVITVVAVLCFLITITTAFEHQLSTKTKFVDKISGALCIEQENDVDNNVELINSTTLATGRYSAPSSDADDNNNYKNFNNHGNEYDDDHDGDDDDGDIQRMNKSDILDRISYYEEDDYIHFGDNERAGSGRRRREQMGKVNDVDDDEAELAEFLKAINGTMENRIFAGTFNTTPFPNETRCHYEHFLYVTPSSLGDNEIYRAVFYPLTSVLFVFLPLVLLATFNCFLVAAVHRSHKMRHRMTNTRQSDSKTSQENKITIILIAVVVLFLICQTPTAVQLILTSFPQEEMDHRTGNMHKALGNLMNFLVTMNAACNFLLYCALSDKYRQTVRTLIFRKKPQRQHTVSSSRFSRYASRGAMERSSFRNTDAVTKETTFTTVSMTPRQSLIPAAATTVSLVPSARARTPRISLSSTSECPEVVGEVPSRKSSNVSNNSIATQNIMTNNNKGLASIPLKLSPSQTSLTRSHSLNSRPSIKHSPDCKSNVHKF